MKLSMIFSVLWHFHDCWVPSLEASMLILTMTSEHDFCFSIFITFLWLYLCLAAWVKLVNHGAMLKVISYHFCIFHLYNGNINISNSQSHGGSRSPHWASPAWRGLLHFLSPCICLIILTLLLTPPAPPYFQPEYKLISESCLMSYNHC